MKYLIVLSAENLCNTIELFVFSILCIKNYISSYQLRVLIQRTSHLYASRNIYNLQYFLEFLLQESGK